MSPEEIKLLREELGLSQRKLSRLLDVSHTTVQNWEKGTAVPSKMKVDLMKDLRRRARQRQKREGDVEEWIETLLVMAAAGAFGAMLGQIYDNLTSDSEEPDEA